MGIRTSGGRAIRNFVTLPLWKPLFIRDFRLLWLGETFSLLGDQFYLVALAWLTLQISGSGLVLGTVLMAAAIPRALFVLVGGVATDHFHPRWIMLVSNAGRAVAVGLLAFLVLSGAVRLLHLYAIGALFGLVDAFFYPAFMAIVPSLLDKNRLEAGNALLRGTARLSGLIGPAPAGLLISFTGLGPAFGMNAVTFVASMMTLWAMGSAVVPSHPGQEGLRASISAGFRYVWHDPPIRTLLIIISAVEFSTTGPFLVGLAALAQTRFTGGAVTYGILLSAWGGGAMLGTIAAGSVRIPLNRGSVLRIGAACVGLGLILIGFAPTAGMAAGILAVMGLASGFVQVKIIAWLQARTEAGMRGRVMSIAMLSSVGLAPVSYALTGMLVDIHLPLLFGLAGGLALAAAAFAGRIPAMQGVDTRNPMR